MKIIIAALLVLSLVAGIFVNFYMNSEPKLITTSTFPDPRPVIEFELIDHNSNTFTNAQFINKWSVVFFGYTSCPDICPTTLSAMAKIANAVKPETLQHVQFLFVSVDPKRDTIEKLAEYIPFFHPNFIAITGTDEQLALFSHDLGAVFMKEDKDDGNDSSYEMSHSSSLIIIDPEGRRFGIFSRKSQTIDISSVAQDLDTLVSSR